MRLYVLKLFYYFYFKIKISKLTKKKKMRLLDVFFKKWTNNEKMAYLKALYILAAADGHTDEEEGKAIFSNMKIIKWIPKTEKEMDKFIAGAEKMNQSESIKIIKNMSLQKKKIVSCGLKTMSLADNKLVESEEKFLKEFEAATGIPKVLFSKMELTKFKYYDKSRKEVPSLKYDADYYTVDDLINEIDENRKDYDFLKHIWGEMKTGLITNEEQLNDCILLFFRKHSIDEIISKIVNFQQLENILGTYLLHLEDENNTNFNGYIEIEQYHMAATRAFQTGQSVLFEKI